MSITVGIDVGKNAVKMVTKFGKEVFPAALYPYRNLNLKNKMKKYDFAVEYNGKKYLAGELGKREGEVPLFNADLSKNHEETLIDLLLGLSLLPGTLFQIVITTPITTHNEDEKQALKERFKGWHTIKINDEEKRLFIKDVEIGPEGAIAFWSNPRMGIVRGWDFGSTSVNEFTLIDKEYIDKESDTYPYGDKVTKTDIASTASSLVRNKKGKWNKGDYLMIVGGGGLEAIKTVREYFHNAELWDNFITATAEGAFELARVLYE